MFGFDLPREVLSLIARCERVDLLEKLVGLSLIPEYQSNHPRILTLIQVALVMEGGKRRASYSDLTSMLNNLLKHESGRSEDPSEDVFVSAVSTRDGEFKIFNGIYLAADYSLQRVLDAVDETPARDRILRECNALLILSNSIVERCGFVANEYVKSRPWQENWPSRLSSLANMGSKVRFSNAELAEFGVGAEYLFHSS